MQKIFLAFICIMVINSHQIILSMNAPIESKKKQAKIEDLTSKLFKALYNFGRGKNPTVHNPESKDAIHAIIALIEDGAAVNADDRQGKTPLMLASSKSLFPVVQALLKKGANVNRSDNNGNTALTEGIASFRHTKRYQDAFIITALLKKGALTNSAVKQGNITVTPLMLLFEKDEHDLSNAFLDQRLDIARLLLEHNADPNAIDSNGNTVLQYAKAWGPEAQKLVMDYQEKHKKANATITTELLENPSLHTDVIDIVKEYAQQPNKTTAILQQIKGAIHDNNLNSLKLLMRDPENLERADVLGYTPLLEAVDSNNVPAVRFLLELGADKQARLGTDKTGLNAHELAQHIAKIRTMTPSEKASNSKIIRILSPQHVVLQASVADGGSGNIGLS